MDAPILVVDDDPAIRTLINRVLTRDGYQVREAEDGLVALEVVAVERPAMVLADVMMPRMNGESLVAHLMQQSDPIRCILMSVHQTEVRSLGVPFLGKPFALETLLGLVADVVREQR